jgi:predicted amidohydrolase YtcJ
MSTDWLIKNAELVNEGRRFHADLRVKNGRIETIGDSLDARPGEQVIDATGLWLLPGMIDDQVHFREPGLTHKADIGTSRAPARPAASPASWKCPTPSRRRWIANRWKPSTAVPRKPRR